MASDFVDWHRVPGGEAEAVCEGREGLSVYSEKVGNEAGVRVSESIVSLRELDLGENREHTDAARNGDRGGAGCGDHRGVDALAGASVISGVGELIPTDLHLTILEVHR
jgi:hypothetical protein